MNEPIDTPLPQARELADDLRFDLRDRNGDGKLTEAEFDRARGVTARLQDPDGFARYDADGDGLVDREEWHAGRDGDRRPAT